MEHMFSISNSCKFFGYNECQIEVPHLTKMSNQKYRKVKKQFTDKKHNNCKLMNNFKNNKFYKKHRR